jgi:hypothetical protein
MAARPKKTFRGEQVLGKLLQKSISINLFFFSLVPKTLLGLV